MSALGRTVGREFVIERLLGSGGMGAVFVALQKSTGIRRAVKLMRPEIVRDAQLRERFAQEARMGGLIPSDHVVQVIAAGIDDETSSPFLVMELLEGDSLSAAIQHSGALDTATFAILFDQLCHALGAAHQAGIVHRDLKPENIFLARSRIVGTPIVVKVLDFGIAKILAEARASTTIAIGTPLWMAPEQTARGSRVSVQTDVWALGLIAFFCLTGHVYWRSGEDDNASMQQILREVLMDDLVSADLRADELGLLLPPWFGGWFARCVNREPQARFRDANELLLELRRLCGGHSDFVPSTSPISFGKRSVRSGFPGQTQVMTAPPSTAADPLHSTSQRGVRSATRPSTIAKARGQDHAVEHASFANNGGPPQLGVRATWVAFMAMTGVAVVGTLRLFSQPQADPKLQSSTSAAAANEDASAKLPVAESPASRPHLVQAPGTRAASSSGGSSAHDLSARLPSCSDPKTEAERSITPDRQDDSVEVRSIGDLDGDGHDEFSVDTFWVALYRIQVATTLLGRDANGCARPLLTDASGRIVKVLDSRTRGWKDLELATAFNWAPISQTCVATALAQYDGTRYQMVKVISVEHYLDTGQADLGACREEANKLLGQRSP